MKDSVLGLPVHPVLTLREQVGHIGFRRHACNDAATPAPGQQWMAPFAATAAPRTNPASATRRSA